MPGLLMRCRPRCRPRDSQTARARLRPVRRPFAGRLWCCVVSLQSLECNFSGGLDGNDRLVRPLGSQADENPVAQLDVVQELFLVDVHRGTDFFHVLRRSKLAAHGGYATSRIQVYGAFRAYSNSRAAQGGQNITMLGHSSSSGSLASSAIQPGACLLKQSHSTQRCIRRR